MNDKAGLAANQDYGKDESSAEKLLTRHTALQTAVDTYSPVIQGLAKQAKKLVQSGHFAAAKIGTRQVKQKHMFEIKSQLPSGWLSWLSLGQTLRGPLLSYPSHLTFF